MTNKCRCGKEKYRRAYSCGECWQQTTQATRRVLVEDSGRTKGHGTLRLASERRREK